MRFGSKLGARRGQTRGNIEVVGSMGEGVRLLASASLAGLLVMTVFGFGSAGATGSPRVAAMRLGLPTDAIERPELRTATSRTYALPGGKFKAVYSQTPVNYRDGRGRWRRIDSSLVAKTGAFENKANSFRLRLPRDLSDSVQLTQGNNVVSFSLHGASGSAAVSGSTATYARALPGVTVRYQSEADGVKEALILTSRAAVATSLRYSLELGHDMALRTTRGGGVTVLGSDGNRAFQITAPFMVDATGEQSDAISYKLNRTSARVWTLNLVPSTAWLMSPARKWPVTIDPTIQKPFTPASVCSIASGSPNSSFCSTSEPTVGQNAGGTWRSLLSWSSSSLPPGVTVVGAYVWLWVFAQQNTSPFDFAAYPQTRANTQSATWNTYDGTNAWTSPGGDFSALLDQPAHWTGQNPGSDGFLIDATKIVRGWVDGSIPNAGIVLKPTSEPAPNALQFYQSHVSLSVIYIPQAGIQRQFSYQQQRLSDRSELNVNVASGDLILKAADAQLPGVGTPLSLTRYYDSRNISGRGAPRYGNDIGGGWALTPGYDVGLLLVRNYAVPQFPVTGVELTGLNGEDIFFAKSGSSYQTPAGVDADLVDNGNGTFALTYHESGQRLIFSNVSGANTDNYYLTSETDRNNNQITLQYGFAPSWNPSPQVTSITDTYGRLTTFNYDNTDSGILTGFTDPAGRTYQYRYDNGCCYDRNSSDLTSYTDADGKTTTYSYDSGSHLTQITDALGHATKMTYDSWGRITSITRGLDSTGQACLLVGGCPTTSYSYQPAGTSCPGSTGQTVATDPRNNQWTYCYDGQLRVTKTIDPDGHTQKTDYTDANGGSNCADHNPCSTTDAFGKTTKFGYNDGSGSVQKGENLLWQQSPLEAATNRPTLFYQDSSNKYSATQFTDPQYAPGGSGAHSWLYSYDSPGNLRTKSEGDASPGQNPVIFTYNGDGTLATATDAKSNVTQYCYDLNQDCTGATTHNLTAIIPPTPLGPVKLTYDSLNRIHTITDGKGQTRTFTYDPLDRATQIVYTGGPTFGYGYDADGNVTSTSDSSGSYTYIYDAANQLKEEDQPGVLQTIHYTYDLNGNLATLQDIAGNTTTYTYTKQNEVETIQQPSVTGTIQFGYNADLNQTSIKYPGNTYVCGSYDDAQRITSVVSFAAAGNQDCSNQPATTITKFVYTYTGGSLDTDLRQTMQSTYGSGAASTLYYCYTGLGQLQAADTSQPANCPDTTAPNRYVYDLNGNMNAMTEAGITKTFNFNNANQITNTGYSFDANGSQTNGNNIFSAATYNNADQLASITPTGGSAKTMSYNDLGQAKRLSAGAASMVNDQLGLEKTSNGTTTTFFTRTPDGAIVGERTGTGSYTPYYFTFDALGSVTGVVDGNATTQELFKYSPYGTPSCASQTCTLYEPIQYAGGYTDSADGNENLVKFGQRYYDPSVGRWTQDDPLDNPLDLHGWNGYKYAGDDPINVTDPMGLCVRGTCWVKHTVHRINRWSEQAQDWEIQHIYRPASKAAAATREFLATRTGRCVAGAVFVGGLALRYGARDPRVVLFLGAVGCVAAMNWRSLRTPE